jgi:hypothetical protein
MGAERDRVAGFGHPEFGLREASPWYEWGPYLSERQWGTVREDYSADGEAWGYLPHDHARSRAYRWGEDGLAGFSDSDQRLCLALALWNGRDPFLKERPFGLTGPQGNHGEDVKDYWWYLDALPSHAWNHWRYHYPQAEFPYDRLVHHGRTREQPELELLDTGVFDDDRYWVVDVHYVKADPTDLLISVELTNAGPEPATLHVLPTAWLRNTWSWEQGAERPELSADGDGTVRVDHPTLGELELIAGPGPDGTPPELLFCHNETNVPRLFGGPPDTPYPKDGINDHVVSGAATVDPDRRGSKCAAWYRVTVAPGATERLRLRLRPAGAAPERGPALGADFDRVLALRGAEADEFYAELTPDGASADEALVMRQAFAGLLWGKQLYHYDVRRWLDGDPAQPPPPQERLRGRNARWGTFNAFDVMSMPDKWEYPWFAAWDLGFHCVPLAHVDPAFAKYQLLLLCREWFQHPTGALPAYEWDFGDVNPPVHAWAALQVFAVDGGRDVDFLARVFDKLLVNFTWWVNREDADGSNLFEGGFLGLDNISPIDRSHLPVGGQLQQSDATGWMAGYSLAMMTIAELLHRTGHRPELDLAHKFLEHFADIRDALDLQGMWDEQDGMFHDRIVCPSGEVVPVRVRSMVGVIPVLAVSLIGQSLVDEAGAAGKRFARFLRRFPPVPGPDGTHPDGASRLLGVVDPQRLTRMLTALFDEHEFLSPYGLRALSARYRDQPYELDVEGLHATIRYEPAESTVPMFGGNSNWRGPIWFPVNYLVTNSLERYQRCLGPEFTVEFPTGSGERHTLDEVTADLWDRLVSIFLVGPDGRRPCYGGTEKFQQDPRWRDNITFSEYFHGDNGAGLGASHQTGWTALVADIIRRRHGAVPALFDALSAAGSVR